MESVKQIIQSSKELLEKADSLKDSTLPFISASLLRGEIEKLQELDSSEDYDPMLIESQKITCQWRYINLEYSLISFYKECGENYSNRSKIINIRKEYDKMLLSVIPQEGVDLKEFFSMYKSVTGAVRMAKECTFSVTDNKIKEYSKVLNSTKKKLKNMNIG